MKLSDLKKETRKVTVTIGQQSAEVEYRLHAVTPTLLSELREMDDIEGIIHQVEDTVVRWDVLDDEGREIPVTREAILKYELPLAFLGAVLNAITDDMKQDAAAKNA